jgi:precorrin-3B synthase
VHQAQDGGLARIRVPGGVLPRDVLVALARWARELGNGRLELTSRGNLQLRGLAAGAETELSQRLHAWGLLPSPAHDTARNIVASPLSGRDGVGAVDIRPLVGELDRRLCADPRLARLSGRFLFALDDGRGDVAGLTADVAVLALPGQRAALVLGGRDSGLRLPMREAVSGAIAAALSFLSRRTDERVWRLGELPGGPGVVADDLVHRSELDIAAGPPVSVPERDPIGPIGRIEQADGRFALGVSVPLGELTPARCQVLADTAEREVVLTPWRSVVIPDLSPGSIAPAERRLDGAGLVGEASSPALGVSACTGRPGCAKALADVRADASVAAGHAAGTALEPTAGSVLLPVHWSGCERRCGRPVGPVVDVVAESDGYRISREGESVLIRDDEAGSRSLTEVRAVGARMRAQL